MPNFSEPHKYIPKSSTFSQTHNNYHQLCAPSVPPLGLLKYRRFVNNEPHKFLAFSKIVIVLGSPNLSQMQEPFIQRSIENGRFRDKPSLFRPLRAYMSPRMTEGHLLRSAAWKPRRGSWSRDYGSSDNNKASTWGPLGPNSAAIARIIRQIKQVSVPINQNQAQISGTQGTLGER